MLPNGASKKLAMVLLALMAGLAPAQAAAQVSSELQAEISRALATRTEARLRLLGPLPPADPIVMLRPRLASGLLVGEVATGSMGEIAVYESMAFPLDQVRELRVKENRFIEGTIVGAALGLVTAAVFHARCEKTDCDGPYSHPAVYALSGSIFAGLGGAIGTFALGWRVIYTYQPRGLRIAD